MDKEISAINLVIDPERCKGCEFCCAVCPKQILNLSKDYNRMGHHFAVVQDSDKCSGCRFCAIMCPELAIELLVD